MMGGRAEQVAEAADGMRPDRVLSKAPTQIRSRPLPTKTLKWLNQNAVITSWSWRGPSIARMSRAFTASRMTIALLDSQVLGRVLNVRFVAASLGLGLFALLHERPLIFDEQRDRRHLQRAIFADALDQVGGNRDRLGMQLFLHVAFRPNRADMLEVARPRPEGEPVEYVQNSVLLSFFANHDRSLVCIVRTRVAEDSQY